MKRKRKCKAPKPVSIQALKAQRRKLHQRAPLLASWLDDERRRQAEHMRAIAAT